MSLKWCPSTYLFTTYAKDPQSQVDEGVLNWNFRMLSWAWVPLAYLHVTGYCQSHPKEWHAVQANRAISGVVLSSLKSKAADAEVANDLLKSNNHIANVLVAIQLIPNSSTNLNPSLKPISPLHLSQTLCITNSDQDYSAADCKL